MKRIILALLLAAFSTPAQHVKLPPKPTPKPPTVVTITSLTASAGARPISYQAKGTIAGKAVATSIPTSALRGKTVAQAQQIVGERLKCKALVDSRPPLPKPVMPDVTKVPGAISVP